MYIQKNISHGKNGKEYSSILLCKKYRMDGKIKTKVVANLSKMPMDIIVAIENSLKHWGHWLPTRIFFRKDMDYGLVFLLVHYNWIMSNPMIAGKLDNKTRQHVSHHRCRTGRRPIWMRQRQTPRFPVR